MDIALLREVFYGPDGPEKLRLRLQQARQAGAQLVLLPELPFHEWIGAFKEPRDEDAEPPQGPRQRLMADAARDSGVGLVGGAILAQDGVRYNTALVYDASGILVGSYRKLHLPCEPGFWETSHYAVGTDPPQLIPGFDMPFGLQICSDVNRPAGSHVLGALGAEAILAPRATEAGTFERWRLMLRANAVASAAYVLSVPRPAAEHGVPLGGPSVVIAPGGEIVVETEEPLFVVRLERARVQHARREYPGYMPVRADLYAAAWSGVANQVRSS